MSKYKQDLTEHIKEMMKEWREIVLPLHSILIWRQNFYPSLIVGLVTALFLLVIVYISFKYNVIECNIIQLFISLD